MRDFAMMFRYNLRVMLNSLRRKKKGRYYFSTTLLVVFGLLILLAISFQAFSYSALIVFSGNVPQMAVLFALALSIFFGLIAAIMRSSTPATAKNADFLLSLPISRLSIISSRVLTQYIIDSFFPLPFYLVPVLTYAIYTLGTNGPGAFIRGLVLVPFIMLPSLGVSYLLGALFRRLERLLKGFKLLISLLSLLLFVGIFFLSTQWITFQNFVANRLDEAIFSDMLSKAGPLGHMTYFITEGGVWNAAVTMMILVIPFAVGLFVFSNDFGRSFGSYRKQKGPFRYRVRPPYLAVFKKEWKKYIGLPIYVVNTAFGPVMLLLLGVAMLTFWPRLNEQMMRTSPDVGAFLDRYPAMLPLLIFGITVAMLALSNTAAVSISLEGKKLWILQAHPISVRDVFVGKCLLNAVVMVPPAILFNILAGARLGLSWLIVLMLVTGAALIGTYLSMAGLMINLWFPKFDWTNEGSVVKQSTSAFMLMLFGFLTVGLIVPPAILFVVIDLPVVATLALFMLLFAVLNLVAYLLLKTVGKKQFLAF